MERYSMFLGRRNQYCANDYTTKCNLLIQCNPYQITNGIFHTTRTKNCTIHLKTQKTPNSQSSLEKEEWSWRNQHSWLQIILQSYSHQDSMVLAQKQKYRPMEQDRKPRNKPMHLSDQISRSVVSDSLWPHESQHARSPCPSPTPGVHPDSRPSSPWYHPAISSSVVPFSSCSQSLPASESFPMSQLFTWGGQSTGDSALASFLAKKSQGWSPSEWTGWISLQSKGLSRVFSNTTGQKHPFFGTQPSSQSNSHIHTWPQEKP